MDNVQYYLSRNNGPQEGPFAFNQISLFATTDRLSPSDLIWREGMTNWQPCSALPEIASFFNRTPTPAPSELVQAGAIGTPLKLAYAGFWARLLAMIIDFLILMVAMLPLSCVTNFLAASANPGGWPNPPKTFDPNDPFGIDRITGEQWKILAVSWFIQFIIQWLYYALMESSSKQATLGKMALRMRVTTLEGNRISFARASGRYFAKFLSSFLLIGYIIAAFMPNKQALHDMLAGTLVYQVRR